MPIARANTFSILLFYKNDLFLSLVFITCLWNWIRTLGETEQAFRAWKTGFVESSDNLTMSIKEALQNWMIGFVNETARREQLTYMQRHLVKPFEVTPTKFLQRIRIMTALLEFLPTTERKMRNISKDELKYIYVYAMPNLFLNKAHEVNFNVHAEALTDINSGPVFRQINLQHIVLPKRNMNIKVDFVCLV